MPTWSALSFQDSSSPLMEQLTMFHDHTMTILILIVSVVGFNMYSTLTNKLMDKNILESQSLELFWTMLECLLLNYFISSTFLNHIGMPSIKLLYLLDEVFHPSITIKTIGHQWYWSYEYSDFSNIEFDSYMISEQKPELTRLLETDNHTIIPLKTQIRNLVTAADVNHSWAVPALGTKVDAIPGRLNQVNFFTNRPGMLYGQCSEICGENHSFMPISVEAVPPKSFIKWVKNFN